MIREIFNAITPENIKSNPLFAEVIEAFLQELEEKAKYSINIKNVFDFSGEENKQMRIQFIKMYLSTFYEILSTLQTTNLTGDSYFDSSSDVVPDIADILTKEYFTTSKTFKENKGTRVAIEYIYKLVERMNSARINSYTPFKLEETKDTNFHFTVEGNITADIYDQLVKPLAHPAGFAYNYSQVLSDLIIDYFSIMIEYKNAKLKVKCLNDEEFDFTELGICKINGFNIAGALLTAELGDKGVLTNLTYSWRKASNPEEISNTKTFRLDNSHIGEIISCTISYIEEEKDENNITLYFPRSITGSSGVIQAKDGIGRVYISGKAQFLTSASAGEQFLYSEVFDPNGIDGAISYKWLLNGYEGSLISEAYRLPLRYEYIAKSITLQVEYKDLLGNNKTATDTIDYLTNNWNDISGDDYGYSYKIREIVEDYENNFKLIKFIFSNGEYLKQLSSPSVVDIKWYNADNEVILDFTPIDSEGKRKQCSIEFEAEKTEISKIDDFVLDEQEDTGMHDDMWTDVDYIIKISNELKVGGFAIGQGIKKFIEETLTDLQEYYATYGNFDYQIPAPGVPTIGSTVIGAFTIGLSTGFETISNETSEYYNMRSEVTEELIIEII